MRWTRPAGRGRLLWCGTSPETWDGQRSLRPRSESSLSFAFSFLKMLSVSTDTGNIVSSLVFTKCFCFRQGILKKYWSPLQKCCLNKSRKQHSSTISHWLGFSCSPGGGAGGGAQRCDFPEVFHGHHVQTSAGWTQIHLHPLRRRQIGAQASWELLQRQSGTRVSLWKQEHSAHGKVPGAKVRMSLAVAAYVCAAAAAASS